MSSVIIIVQSSHFVKLWIERIFSMLKIETEVELSLLISNQLDYNSA